MRVALPIRVGLLLAAATGVRAGTILIDVTGQGWMTGTMNNFSLSGNNYVAGNCGAGDCYLGEFRNFFQFRIPSLDGPVLAATLLLNTQYEAMRQGPSIAYQVASLPESFGFNDLGNGAVYGERTYTAADQYLTEGISLDDAALAAIQASQGGTFSVGGRVTSAVTFDGSAPDQLLFGRGSGAQQLMIVTGSPGITNFLSGPVQLDSLPSGQDDIAPEPAPALMLGAALAGLVLRRRGRRRGTPG